MPPVDLASATSMRRSSRRRQGPAVGADILGQLPRVKNGPRADVRVESDPPQQRTLAGRPGMSQKCQEETFRPFRAHRQPL